MKDVWQPGSWAWFEYHCDQSWDSADAHLYIRSWRPVQVLSLGECDVVEELETITDRLDAGMPLVYRVRFPDGLVGNVFEDELLTSPNEFLSGWGPPNTSSIASGYAPEANSVSSKPTA